ncbi:hypothetical protein GCM10023205_61800 [Yinghuangia aomiensis]|uniref:ABC transporter domain-containing protein n=1 Tax=Yinghuangia aomiensis TaxID=676205 RepID=A0ABP9I0M5_9ACTN
MTPEQSLRHLPNGHCRSPSSRPAEPCPAAPRDGQGKALDPIAATRPTAQAKRGLAARGITVAFGSGKHQTRALDTVDVTLHPGEAVAIVGPSGSGKTTLLRVLVGLTTTAAGTVSLGGTPMPASVRRRGRDRQRRIQLIPQNPLATPNPSRTVGAALERPLKLHTALSRERRRQRIAELLDLVELPADFATRYPTELSGGQRQRVAIARALATEPDYLLCDEITSALGPATTTAIMELLRSRCADHGTALAVVTHEHRLRVVP